MDKKKILILLILFVAVAGMTLAPVSATKKTIYFTKERYTSTGDLGRGDYCTLFYGKSQQDGDKYKTVKISVCSDSYKWWVGKYYKATKAKVYYKKSNNGKTMTKTYKINYSSGGNFMSKKLPSGYKPTKAIVYYQKK